MLLLPAQEGLAFIAVREAYVATTYMDAHAPANGFGQNDPLLQPGEVTTMPAAIRRFIDYTTWLTGEVSKLIRPQEQAKMVLHEIDAIRSLAYNIGPHGSYVTRPGGGLAYQDHLMEALELYLDDTRSDPVVTATLRDLVGKEITKVNEDQKTGRPFNASRRWREAILFVTGDYGDISELETWPEGKDPKRDPATIEPMPRFI